MSEIILLKFLLISYYSFLKIQNEDQIQKKRLLFLPSLFAIPLMSSKKTAEREQTNYPLQKKMFS